MTNKEAVNWLINITADIGKTEHRDLWHYEQALTEIKDMLESEQPEIVRCGECKHNGTHNCLLNLWATIFNSKPKDDFFCGMAERRTDGQG